MSGVRLHLQYRRFVTRHESPVQFSLFAPVTGYQFKVAVLDFYEVIFCVRTVGVLTEVYGIFEEVNVHPFVLPPKSAVVQLMHRSVDCADSYCVDIFGEDGVGDGDEPLVVELSELV